MNWRGSTTIGERICAALPYLLVLYDGIPFSDSILRVFPWLATVLYPILLPVILLYRSFPFASLIVFFGLFFFVIRNEKIKHFIRFNTMQALLLTIILFVVQLILGFLGGGLGALSFLFTAINTSVFLAVLIAFIFAVVQTLRGLYAELPSISEAVYLQVP